MVREAGLEPARPEWTLEPESSESANSTTRASAPLDCLDILSHGILFVKNLFEVTQLFCVGITMMCYRGQ